MSTDLEKVQQDGMYLGSIDSASRTTELCTAAVTQNGLALQFVPYNLQTSDIAMIAVKQNVVSVKYYVDANFTFCISALQQGVPIFTGLQHHPNFNIIMMAGLQQMLLSRVQLDTNFAALQTTVTNMQTTITQMQADITALQNP